MCINSSLINIEIIVIFRNYLSPSRLPCAWRGGSVSVLLPCVDSSSAANEVSFGSNIPLFWHGLVYLPVTLHIPSYLCQSKYLHMPVHLPTYSEHMPIYTIPYTNLYEWQMPTNISGPVHIPTCTCGPAHIPTYTSGQVHWPLVSTVY